MHTKDATAAFGTERVKELLTRGGGGGNDNDPAEARLYPQGHNVMHNIHTHTPYICAYTYY